MASLEIPYGWSYNPSEWSQRIPILSLALLGFGIATYLAFYQYRLVEDVHEPFFGEGSRMILDSELSRILPISDAALGALAYLADAITGMIGGQKRWQTMPWMVIIFAILVGPLGAVSVGLVIAQPLLYNAWCTLCLLSAIVSILMIGPSMDEALASLQYLCRVRQRKKHSVWKVFWGIEQEEDPLTGQGQPDQRSMEWPQVVAVVLGTWLIIAPSVLFYGESAEKVDRIIGPLIVTFATVAIWDVTRALRWSNVILGFCLLVLPWILNYSATAILNAVIVGILLIFVSGQKGKIHHRMEGGWSILWKP